MRQPRGVFAVIVSVLALQCGLGCAESHPVTNKMSNASIESRLVALAEEPFAGGDLGTPFRARSDNIDRIVCDRRTVPFLVQAIASELLQRVGFAAYCLQLMKARDGVEAARSRLRSLQDSKEPIYLVAFAHNCLRDYVGESLTLPLKRGMTLEEAVIALTHHAGPMTYVGSLAAESRTRPSLP